MTSLPLQTLSVPAAIKKSLTEMASSTTFDKYSSKGANGYLFFGENTVLGRRVAVKYYYWGGDKRFHVEPQLLSTLNSDHIIPVLDAGVIDDDWAYFLTPFCNGGDLDDFLKRGPLPLRRALEIARQVLVGLARLHGARIIHRDLKPENILYKDANVALIADFGSVKRLPGDQSDVPASGHSALYRPPEAWVNGRYGSLGDLYQVGILLYQLLGGYLPYEATAWLNRNERREYWATSDDFERSKIVNQALRRRAESSRLLSIRSLPPWVPKSLRRLIRKATHSKPEARFGTCTQFLAKIQELSPRILQWESVGESARLALGDRIVFVSPNADAQYVVTQDKGRGFRRDGRFAPTSFEEQVRAVSAKYEPS